METSFLDTTNLKTMLPSQPIETHDRFGVGELYQLGVTRVELFMGTTDSSPVARLRMPGGMLAFSDVSEVKAMQDGGLLIDCAKQGQKPHCSISINRFGEIAFVYAPPPAPMQFNENGMKQKIRGKEYAQSTIDIEGTPEGVKVRIRGTVDAAPRPVDSKNPRSPLTFFLIEDNPAQPDKAVYHEVWAINKPKTELKALKLVKGILIEAIFFRHTYEIELIGGEKETVIRHNLIKVIYVDSGERGHSAKRQRIKL